MIKLALFDENLYDTSLKNIATRARNRFLSWARLIQSTSSYTITPRSILTLSSHVRPGIRSGLFPSSFPTLFSYALLHACYMPRSPHPPWFVRMSIQIMKLLIMQFSQPFCHFIPLRYKHYSKHLVPKLPQTVFFFPWYERPFSHPYKTTGKIILVYFNFYVLGSNGRTEVSEMCDSKHYLNLS
jgi:hypothetical protein